MTALRDEDLHAFIDGELAEADATRIAAMLDGDGQLAARVAAYRADKQRLADVFGRVAAWPLPPAWLATARGQRPRRRGAIVGWAVVAAAACVALALLGGVTARMVGRSDTILAEAAAAREGTLHADQVLTGTALADRSARDRLLQTSVGLPVRAPDLGRFGYRLVALDIFGGAGPRPAAGLVYRGPEARELTIYVRRSAGQAHFDLLRRGVLRVCLWQDNVVGAVITGEMTAGDMMRVASKAYVDLDL